MSETQLQQRRSLSGPIVLIVLGLLLLLANFGYMSWLEFGRYFARYWPVLLILWGAVKLSEYIRDRRAGRPLRGLGVGGTVFLAALVITGTLATIVSRLPLSVIGAALDLDDDLFRSRYSYQSTLEEPFPAGASLRVVSDRGDIVVHAWDQPQLRVLVNKLIDAENQAEADALNSTTDPKVTTADNVITIMAVAPETDSSEMRNRLQIYLPRAAPIEIQLRRGDITIRDRQNNVLANTSRGDVNVHDLQGEVNIELRRGSLLADNIKGNLTVGGRVEDTSISSVSGNVRLAGSFSGRTALARIGGTTSYKDTRTELEIARLDGEFAMESEDLRANNVSGPLRISTRSKDLHLEGVSGEARVLVSNGSVELRAARLGNTLIENDGGDVDVVLPARAGFELEAVARRGEISSDFENIRVSVSDNQRRAQGVAGAGGPKLQIECRNGDIRIRRSMELPGSSAEPRNISAPPQRPSTPRPTVRASAEPAATAP